MLLGITRSKTFSPNMEDKDLAIMKAVASILESHGHDVRLVDEIEWANEKSYQLLPDAAFTMMRSRAGLEKLIKMERVGVPVLNSAQGILCAHRARITRLMRKLQIPLPRTVFCPEESLDDMACPCWVKQGSGWAQDKDDVVFVENHSELALQVTRLKEKYPEETVVVSEHLTGDLVKFYGVEGTDFFHWSYPDPRKTKFGLEQINGNPQYVTFDVTALKTVCDKVASLSGIEVYGGDCIIDSDGQFRIIDFNDWPSFSACREQAAEAIASKIMKLKIVNSN